MLDELSGDFIQWLQGFYYVATTGSVRKAAELMHKNPSTISYQLRALEQELNAVLFDRVKRSLRITAEGRKLLEWTNTTFDALESMRLAVGSSGGHLQGDVDLGLPLPLSFMAVAPIADFQAANPDVHIHIKRALSHEILADLKESRLDFGLAGFTDMPDLDVVEIFLKSRPLLVLRRDMLDRVPSIPTAEDLKKLPYVAFHESPGDSFLSHSLEQASAAYMKNVCISVNNNHIIMQFVDRGLGCAILDEVAVGGLRNWGKWDNLAMISLDHLLPTVLYGILTRHHKRLSPQAQALISALRSHLREVTPKSLIQDESIQAAKPRRTRKRKQAH